MIAVHLGSIPMGSNSLTGPNGRSITRQNTYAQYDVTRGKPVLHEIGEELDSQTFDFFFSEEFCNPAAELASLRTAFTLKTPLPLVFTSGGYPGKRYVVDALDETIIKTSRSGRVVRVEASITLLEAPVDSLSGLIGSVAKARASGLAGNAANNPDVRR